MVLPAALTSVSWLPWVVLLSLTVAFCTAVNFSVVEALWALATAGSTSAPVVPRTTAAPAATKPLAIRLGRLVDGKGQVWTDAVVVVRDESIASVATGDAAVPAEAEVIDLRTLSPIDWDTVVESVENTGRLVVVDEAHPRCSIATDVAAYVGQNAFGALKAGAQVVTAPHTPVPFSPALEDLYIPSSGAIAAAVHRTLARGQEAGAQRKAS